MKIERYTINYTYEYEGFRGEVCKGNGGIGFRNKNNALKKLEEIKNNPQILSSWNITRLIRLQFKTIVVEDIEIREE